MSLGFCNNCGVRRENDRSQCVACGAIHRPPPDPITQAHPLAVESMECAASRTSNSSRSALEVLRGRNVGARFVLGPTTTVGRSADSDIFLDDVSVSRAHARISEVTPGHYVVSDLESLNGTYLAGERVRDAGLRHGDLLQIGMFKLVFIDGSAAGRP